MVDSEDAAEYEYIAQDLAEEIMEIEPTGLFTGMYFIIKKSLRTLKGLNCTIKEVMLIQTVTQNFLNDVKSCGDDVSKKVQKLINACNDIIETCKDILGINESVCGNTEETDADEVQTFKIAKDAKTSHKCFVKMFRKVQSLKKQIKHAIKLIKQIKKVPADSSACVLDAVNTLGNYFTDFPAQIKSCSKLTSN